MCLHGVTLNYSKEITFASLVVNEVVNLSTNLSFELRHPRCVCNIKVQCKEVKNTTSFIWNNFVN